jgi:hypothetical protein
MHVYTEADRPVPSPMIKHTLVEWPTIQSGKSWWYKMQLFNSEHHAGPLLYFDLDTVIVGNIDWIWQLSFEYFWAIRDFKYLWRPNFTGVNSSVMWWDTTKYQYIWNNLLQQNLSNIMLKYRGDQDFISDTIAENQRRFFDPEQVKSWRWQCLDGGYDFHKKRYWHPGKGTEYFEKTSILVFHGNPKPFEINDPIIDQYWK